MQELHIHITPPSHESVSLETECDRPQDHQTAAHRDDDVARAYEGISSVQLASEAMPFEPDPETRWTTAESQVVDRVEDHLSFCIESLDGLPAGKVRRAIGHLEAAQRHLRESGLEGP